MVRPTANGDYESNLSIDKASLHGVRAARLQGEIHDQGDNVRN
jgi:hypothetical protein